MEGVRPPRPPRPPTLIAMSRRRDETEELSSRFPSLGCSAALTAPRSDNGRDVVAMYMPLCGRRARLTHAMLRAAGLAASWAAQHSTAQHCIAWRRRCWQPTGGLGLKLQASATATRIPSHCRAALRRVSRVR